MRAAIEKLREDVLDLERQRVRVEAELIEAAVRCDGEAAERSSRELRDVMAERSHLVYVIAVLDMHRVTAAVPEMPR